MASRASRRTRRWRAASTRRWRAPRTMIAPLLTKRKQPHGCVCIQRELAPDARGNRQDCRKLHAFCACRMLSYRYVFTPTRPACGRLRFAGGRGSMVKTFDLLGATVLGRVMCYVKCERHSVDTRTVRQQRNRSRTRARAVWCWMFATFEAFHQTKRIHALHAATRVTSMC